MQQLILLLLTVVVIACVIGYPAYRNNAQKREREKKRNQFHDRL